MMKMDYICFGKNIKSLIDSSGLTMKAFAERVGLTPPAISRYLTGERKPELHPVVSIAESFGVSVDWLIGLSENKFDTLTDEVREIVNLYSIADADDRKVIRTVLEKYKK